MVCGEQPSVTALEHQAHVGAGCFELTLTEVAVSGEGGNFEELRQLRLERKVAARKPAPKVPKLEVVVDGEVVERNLRLDDILNPYGRADSGELLECLRALSASQESGWQVHITQLVRIIDKPDRAGEDRQNVSFSFLAKPIRQVDKPDDESDKVQWWPLKALPPMAFDHAETVRWVIEHPIQTDFGSMAKHIPWYTFK